MIEIDNLTLDGEDVELTQYAKKETVMKLSEEIVDQQNSIKQNQNRILGLAQGAPPYASTIEKMIDTSIYYLGSNGNLWAYDEYESEDFKIEWYDQRKLSYTVGDSYDSYTTEANYCATNLIPVIEGETIDISTTGFETDLSACRVLYYDLSKCVVSIAINQNSSAGKWETTLTIPERVHYIALRAYYETTNEATIWENGTIEIPSLEVSSGYMWIDTGISYANYALTDSDKTVIAQKMLEILDVSYVSYDNTINVGTYTLKYDSEETTDIGEVTT